MKNIIIILDCFVAPLLAMTRCLCLFVIANPKGEAIQKSEELK
jgi:hypothetical protein